MSLLRRVRAGRRPKGEEKAAMAIDLLLALLALVIGYLLYVVIHPEQF